MRRVISIIAAGPRVDVNDPVWRDRQMAGMSDTVGKDRCTKSGRQFQPAVVVRACSVRSARMVGVRGFGRNRRAVYARRAEQDADGQKAPTRKQYLHW